MGSASLAWCLQNESEINYLFGGNWSGKKMGNLHFTDNLTMSAEPRPKILDPKSPLNLILIPLNLNITPTLTLTLVHKMWKKNKKRSEKFEVSCRQTRHYVQAIEGHAHCRSSAIYPKNKNFKVQDSNLSICQYINMKILKTVPVNKSQATRCRWIKVKHFYLQSWTLKLNFINLIPKYISCS